MHGDRPQRCGQGRQPGQSRRIQCGSQSIQELIPGPSRDTPQPPQPPSPFQGRRRKAEGLSSFLRGGHRGPERGPVSPEAHRESAPWSSSISDATTSQQQRWPHPVSGPQWTHQEKGHKIGIISSPGLKMPSWGPLLRRHLSIQILPGCYKEGTRAQREEASRQPAPPPECPLWKPPTVSLDQPTKASLIKADGLPLPRCGHLHRGHPKDQKSFKSPNKN